MAAIRKYLRRSRLIWDATRMKAALVFLNDEPSEVILTGDCPQCHHPTRFSWPLLVYRDTALEPPAEAAAGGAPAVAAQRELVEAEDAPPFEVGETYEIRVECRCNVGHLDSKGAPHDGCGAYWYKQVQRSEKRVRVGRGRRADAPSTTEAAAIEESAQTQIARTRKQAENWRTGLAGLLTLITAVSVVKGRDTITDLDETAKVVIGVLLLLSVVAAAIGLWSALRAAYGWPEAAGTTFPSQWTPLLKRAEESRTSLTTAVILTYTTFALVVAAVGFTWYASEDPPAFLSVTYTGADGKAAKVCGELKPGKSKTLTVEPDGDLPVTISLDAADTVKVVASCG